MLKYLTILGLLTIMQATVPVPRQAADNPAGGTQKTNDNKAPKDSLSNPGISTVGKSPEREGRKDGDQPSTKNDDQAVTISKFPPVSVAKDWADWAYWVFGGVLVVVGGLQVWLLRGTLRAVEIQGKHMERQTQILADSVAAAQKAADASLAQVEAVKSVQRAQLRVEFVEPAWTVDYEAGGYPVKFRIILDGTTRAYILDDSIIAYIGVKPRERGAWMGMGLPRNFTPEMSPFHGDTILRTVEALPQPETDASKVQLAEESKLTVFLNGRVRYRDLFGDEWVLEIDRYWKSWASFGDEDIFGGNWYPVGSGRHDTHRKVDTSRCGQYLKEKAD